MLAISQFSPETKWLARNAMARNKLICALSKAVVVIESGAERDGKGKMSGTFDTGKTAIKMKLPLFVADPEYFNEPPKGNADLIEWEVANWIPPMAHGTLLVIWKKRSQ